MAVIFRRAGGAHRESMASRLDAGRLKVMGAIEACRTAALGGHIYRGDGCEREHPLGKAKSLCPYHLGVRAPGISAMSGRMRRYGRLDFQGREFLGGDRDRQFPTFSVRRMLFFGRHRSIGVRRRLS